MPRHSNNKQGRNGKMVAADPVYDLDALREYNKKNQDEKLHREKELQAKREEYEYHSRHSTGSQQEQQIPRVFSVQEQTNAESLARLQYVKSLEEEISSLELQQGNQSMEEIHGLFRQQKLDLAKANRQERKQIKRDTIERLKKTRESYSKVEHDKNWNPSINSNGVIMRKLVGMEPNPNGLNQTSMVSRSGFRGVAWRPAVVAPGKCFSNPPHLVSHEVGGSARELDLDSAADFEHEKRPAWKATRSAVGMLFNSMKPERAITHHERQMAKRMVIPDRSIPVASDPNKPMWLPTKSSNGDQFSYPPLLVSLEE